MKISILRTWEELANVDGWSELATSCDGSPFAWPSFCLPWWYEAGAGQLMAVVAGESDVLVGLALLHVTTAGRGRKKLRFLGHGSGSFNQFLVADGRSDITAALWEQLLSPRWDVDLEAIPTEIADTYRAVAPFPLVLSDHADSRVMARPGDADRQILSGTSVRRVTDPEECVALVTGAFRSDVTPVSRDWTFFLAAVDASARSNRLTLHVEEGSTGPAAVSIVIHGSKTSAVWKSVCTSRSEQYQVIFEAVMAEAAERGATQVIWPAEFSSFGLRPVPMSDIKTGVGHHRFLH
jgi:hypothetical protein